MRNGVLDMFRTGRSNVSFLWKSDVPNARAGTAVRANGVDRGRAKGAGASGGGRDPLRRLPSPSRTGPPVPRAERTGRVTIEPNPDAGSADQARGVWGRLDERLGLVTLRPRLA